MLTKTKLREQEIHKIFSKCTPKCFKIGLELGAGAGIQTKFLSSYVEYLTSTDLDSSRFDVIKLRNHNRNVEFQIADAEELSNYFEPKSMELIFASYLLAHLPNRIEALKQIHKVLMDNGIVIFTMPNSLQKILSNFAFYPRMFVSGVKKLHRITMRTQKPRIDISKKNYIKNNMKWKVDPKRNLFFPPLSGVYYSHFEEFQAFKKKNWMKLINSQGFNVIKVIKLRVVSGYFPKTRIFCNILEWFGLSSSDAYISVKQDNQDILFSKDWI